MLRVARSTSTKTGVAPASLIAATGGIPTFADGDDLVAGADAERLEADPDRVGPVRHADGVLGLAVRRELLLEGGVLLAPG